MSDEVSEKRVTQSGGQIAVAPVVDLCAGKLLVESYVGEIRAEFQRRFRDSSQVNDGPHASRVRRFWHEHAARIAEVGLAQAHASRHLGIGLFAVDDVLLREFAANVAWSTRWPLMLPVERAEVVDRVEICLVGKIRGAYARRETELARLASACAFRAPRRATDPALRSPCPASVSR